MAVSYSISFPDPKSHLARVRLTVDEPPENALELWMPVWSPGSYLVREYSRNLQDLTVKDAGGTVLPVIKTAKNRWRVEHGGGPVTVHYAVYGLEKSVRTNWIDVDHAFLNGPSTFLLPHGTEGPFRVKVDASGGWDQVYCPLAPADQTASLEYTAPDLDTLLDSPILAGTPRAYHFEAGGKAVSLINVGEAGLWDGAQAVRNVETIVNTYGELYGDFPFTRYLFYNLIVEAGGGLEHKDCSVLMSSRYAFRNRDLYVKWLSLVSHEFFHVWNVKRSRPVELGPFDYEREVYTRSLWVAEGITAYYTDLMPKRAGLFSEGEYLKLLSAKLNQLYGTPGRRLQSLEDSSFDAWIKLYRADENTVNSTVSYYLKGCLVGWLLDVEIRRRSGGNKSLDDLMLDLYSRFAGDRGFTQEEVQAAAEAAAGEPLQDFFEAYVRGTEELDYGPALDYLGLELEDTADSEPTLGVHTDTRENRIIITAVLSDGAGRAAGLMPEDELLAVDGFRVTPDNREKILKQFTSGDSVEVTVNRNGRLRTLRITLGEAPPDLSLKIDSQAEESARLQRRAWWER